MGGGGGGGGVFFVNLDNETKAVGVWQAANASLLEKCSLCICLRYYEGSKHMPVADYRLYGALWQELFGRSLQDPPRPPETRFLHTAMHGVW